MNATRSSPLRTTLRMGESLVSALWTMVENLIRERRPAPTLTPDKHALEHAAMMEAADAPLVTNDPDADAFEALKGRQSRRVAKPLPIK